MVTNITFALPVFFKKKAISECSEGKEFRVRNKTYVKEG
jgi:hypothetical protein